uniref:Uncharacterized protein n=1 Tax=Vannella robusta TaxID=1487602 RepID=A0A7S4HZP9_9EUKA|mmetsp:Transcript_18230/g.23082  ORF Transcript_18230/g.23082 Transcript_18230/m.23082 type:complete len:187 (+) Transcript_18230:40-600(+)
MSLHKIVLFGDHKVGKSCFMIRITQNLFVGEYQPHMDSSHRRMFPWQEEELLLEFLEVPLDVGEPGYQQYFNAATVIVLMFPLQSSKSLDFVAGHFNKMGEKRPVLLLGTKCDEKERRVSTNEACELAEAMDAPYFECSSKENTNFDQILPTLLELVHNNSPRATSPPNSHAITTTRKPKHYCVIV